MTDIRTPFLLLILTSLFSPSIAHAVPGYEYAGTNRDYVSTWVRPIKKEKMFVTYEVALDSHKYGVQKLEQQEIINCQTMQINYGDGSWNGFGPQTMGMATYDALCSN